jgi:hypothetical protein
MIQEEETGVSPAKIDEKVEFPPLDFVSAVHFPDRFIIANELWAKTSCETPEVSLIESLRNLCRPGKYILYYYG